MSTTVPPLVKGLDDYDCYSVKSEKSIPTHPISVIDQFGKAGGSALQPLGLCAPAQINGSALIDASDAPGLLRDEARAERVQKTRW